MGYFGEVMAGFLSEHIAPFGIDWHTPVFLFRFHEDANQYLHRLRQLVEEGHDLTLRAQQAVPGRHGDDSVSFTRDTSGRITAVLVCEAKCLQTSDNRVINDAYTKISRDGLRPDCLYQLIEILNDYSDDDSVAWRDAFRELQHSTQADLQQFRRYHAITYICGHTPVQGTRTCWLPKEQPHTAYSSPVPLEAIEVCINGIQELVIELYRS